VPLNCETQKELIDRLWAWLNNCRTPAKQPLGDVKYATG
jgi:hypothetical protein